MKTLNILHISFFAISINCVYSQNLVVNGDFEADPQMWIQNWEGVEIYPTGWTASIGPLSRGAFISGIMAEGTIGRENQGMPLGAGSPETSFNFWGPTGEGGNGGSYAGSLDSMESPSGGNFYFSDGDPQYAGFLSQTISGLIVGNTYELTFDWAAGQMWSHHGPTTESWLVYFGDEIYQTEILANDEHDFQPWRSESVIFTATATSQVLSFLAVGTPAGMPPVSLLDNVSLVAVPEPSCTLLAAVCGSLALISRRRRG